MTPKILIIYTYIKTQETRTLSLETLHALLIPIKVTDRMSDIDLGQAIETYDFEKRTRKSTKIGLTALCGLPSITLTLLLAREFYLFKPLQTNMRTCELLKVQLNLVSSF